MTDKTRRLLSIAFTVYNKERAAARRRGDARRLEALNKVLGNMVKAARRSARAGRLSPVGLA